MMLIDRFHPKRRALLQAAIDAGQIEQVDELGLLEPEQILTLARLSLRLLLCAGIFFIIVNLAAYTWRTGQQSAALSPGLVFAWLGINILSYIVMLLVHELLHGLTITLLGGRPHYGAHLPFALYCGAKDQMFPRNSYIAIAGAPLCVISLAALIFTLLAPGLSSFILFANAGNVSGAAGDLLTIQRLHRLPSRVLVEDRKTGYRAWEVTAAARSAPFDPIP
jgi:hypothetical protein